MKDIFRLGNIGVRICVTLEKDNSKKSLDIVKYYPNPFYKRKDDFEKSPLGVYYPKEGIVGYVIQDETSFDIEEYCYTVATIDVKDKPDVKSVGFRLFELDKIDKECFDKIIKDAYQLAIDLYCGKG